MEGSMKTPHQRSTEKGRAAMAMARRIFEARGALIETAPNVVRWRPDLTQPRGPDGKPKLVPFSTRHDFFTIWDALVVEEDPDRRRHTYFVQVTEVGNMGHRRAKILANRFPCAVGDLLMGYRGRGVFRVLRGPTFDGEAEEWKVPAPKAVKAQQDEALAKEVPF
jgi:hypothetical protein